MPRSLKADPVLTALARTSVTILLQFLMRSQMHDYKSLSEKLNKLGYEQNTRNLRNKIARGEMSAADFLVLLRILNAPMNQMVENLPIFQYDPDHRQIS